MKISVLLLSCSLVWLACTTGGNCRQQAEANAKLSPTPAPLTASAAAGANIPALETSPVERVSVFKYDGSLQCGLGKAIPVEDMRKELNGLQVYSSWNKPDGLMHIQACGTHTGRANVYEVNRRDLATAIQAGFKEWLWK